MPEGPLTSRRAQIYYLNKATQPELQRHINGLPALFLDCNDDIDLEHDTGAKARFAQQISEFSTFVRQLQARRCAPPALCRGPCVHVSSWLVALGLTEAQGRNARPFPAAAAFACLSGCNCGLQQCSKR